MKLCLHRILLLSFIKRWSAVAVYKCGSQASMFALQGIPLKQAKAWALGTDARMLAHIVHIIYNCKMSSDIILYKHDLEARMPPRNSVPPAGLYQGTRTQNWESI